MRKFIALATVVTLMLASAGVAAQDEVATEPYSPEDGAPVWRASILKGSNGTYVGPDGKVYAASVGGDEITVQDPDTGEILDRIGPERGVHGPDDVFVTNDGTIYWTELLAGNVGMLKPDGTFTTQQVGPGVNPITMSDDGRLFVARDFMGDGLYELDPELVEPPRVVIEDLVGMNGMDFGPDGLLYGPLFFGGAIARVDVDAEEPTAEIVAEGFRIPSAVKFDSSGQLYVVDLAEGQILKVDMEGGDHEVLLDIEGTLDNMAFDSAGRIFTAASSDGQILRWSPGGEVEPLNEAGWPSPSGVAITPDGTVWVAADPFSIRGIGANGEVVTTFYDRYDPPGMEPATGFSLSADGDELISTSWFSNAVQVFDPVTGAVAEDIRTLAVPLNAIRHGDALVAAQGGLPDGNNVVNATTGDELIGGLVLPTGLTSDGDTLYVADWAQGTVFAVPSDGDAVPLATDLAFPEGLALDGDRLLVVEEGLDRVSAIDLASGAVTPVIEGLDLGARVTPGALPFGMLTGVAVGPNGSIYVTEDVTNTVYEFTR